MAETPDASQPSPSIVPVAPEAAESAPVARNGVPLCYLVDEEASIRHFLSLVMHGAGIDAVEFPDGASLRAAVTQKQPDLIFHNISLESADAIESVILLGKLDFRGAIQLMSNRGAAVLDHVKSIGIQNKLNMLPVLKKPFETEAVLKILEQLKLGIPSPVAARIELAEALANNWVEFWYQPKIDLRKKRLAGAEAFARARHPQHGLLLPNAFMTGASDADVLKLSEMALLNALKAGSSFSKLGINLRIAVNIPLQPLSKLPVVDIVRSQRGDVEKWPGLVIDVPEDQIINDLSLAIELNKTLEASNVRLAIDDFGKAYAALTKIRELPFAEFKLDRTFVVDCGTDKVNAPLCKTVIDLAHSFGSLAVAIGIEKASDAVAVVSMGCDYGQGFLLGQPMPQDRFISLLRQRAGANGKALADEPQPA
jgi:EAL domain-containing protein (putative c-di-GMP-specific phosphodiesterase class I)